MLYNTGIADGKRQMLHHSVDDAMQSLTNTNNPPVYRTLCTEDCKYPPSQSISHTLRCTSAVMQVTLETLFTCNNQQQKLFGFDPPVNSTDNGTYIVKRAVSNVSQRFCCLRYTFSHPETSSLHSQTLLLRALLPPSRISLSIFHFSFPIPMAGEGDNRSLGRKKKGKGRGRSERGGRSDESQDLKLEN